MFKDQMAKEATLQMDHLLSDIKQKEARMQEITLHKAAKEAFDQLELKKIPRIVELNEEFILLAKEKNAEYAQYRTERERMRNFANAKRNAEMILKRQGENVESKDRTQTK